MHYLIVTFISKLNKSYNNKKYLIVAKTELHTQNPFEHAEVKIQKQRSIAYIACVYTRLYPTHSRYFKCIINH